MKFFELNKKCYVIKYFIDKLVDFKDVCMVIEIVILVLSVYNSQFWKFVVVCEKNVELVKLVYGLNYEQVLLVFVIIVLFIDIDLVKRVCKIV